MRFASFEAARYRACAPRLLRLRAIALALRGPPTLIERSYSPERLYNNRKMKVLYLKEADVERLVAVPEVIDVLDQAFRDQATGRAFTNPRTRLRMRGGTLHMMAAAIPGYFGYKAYTVAAGKARFQFFLFEAQTAELVAIMEADRLGQIRTGAATGLATRILSNPDAAEAAIFGTGWQAETQLLAMDAVRNLKRVWVVNRSPERRETFIAKMQDHVKARIAPAGSAEQAVRSSQIVTAITSSREPVFRGEWVHAGQHINAVGGNMLLRREIDDETLLRAHRIVVDSLDQAKNEAGEFLGVIETGRLHWEDFVELRDLAAGWKPGRTSSEDITLFKSQGLALEDVAIGKLVYERALERGMGARLEI
ncbi:MAG: ornithine cyclodeaminase [Acidobacteria bacterium]|nr:MAG: ornithine cyclodeaminase [Acidobacteriota bacterium]